MHGGTRSYGDLSAGGTSWIEEGFLNLFTHNCVNIVYSYVCSYLDRYLCYSDTICTDIPAIYRSFVGLEMVLLGLFFLGK